jgi:creatinine amidohydrolase
LIRHVDWSDDLRGARQDGRRSWVEYTAPELRELIRNEPVIVIPIGSIEQHGPHLPVIVDSLLACEVAHRALEWIPDDYPVLIGPTLPIGLAEHHMGFGGTFSLSASTFKGMVRDVCMSLVRQDVGRILFVNGHGGNAALLGNIAAELTPSIGARVVACTYWKTAAVAFGRILESQTNVGHACEAETSMMLALAGDTVRRDKVAQAHHPMPSAADLDGVPRKTFAELAPGGVMGDARTATAAKGERLFAAAAQQIAKLVMARETWEFNRYV